MNNKTQALHGKTHVMNSNNFAMTATIRAMNSNNHANEILLRGILGFFCFVQTGELVVPPKGSCLT